MTVPEVYLEVQGFFKNEDIIVSTSILFSVLSFYGDLSVKIAPNTA